MLVLILCRSANDEVPTAGSIVATSGEAKVQEDDCIRCFYFHYCIVYSLIDCIHIFYYRCGNEISLADCTAYRDLKVQETYPRYFLIVGIYQYQLSLVSVKMMSDFL